MLGELIGFAVGIIGNYVATTTQPPIANPWQRRIEERLADEEALRKALAAIRSFRDEVRQACRELSRERAALGNIGPLEREIWLLLSDVRFQDDLADWLRAGGIEEGAPIRARLEATMERALLRGGASDEQIAAFKASYFERLDRAIFASPVMAAWRHQRSLDYLREQVGELRRLAEEAAGVYSVAKRQEALGRYLEQALKEWDIIDLTNLPEGDIHIATQKLLLRQLYVPLRVTVEVEREQAAAAEAFATLEQRREERRRREAGWSAEPAPVNPQERVPAGLRLGAAGRLVVLGDPGGGKTTLLRWMATAYLLRYRGDAAAAHIPDVETLPDKRWIPVLIRCRDLGEVDLSRSFVDFLAQHLLKTELSPAEADVMKAVILDLIVGGDVLLLVDGLDEISSSRVRVQFCQELERTAARYPGAHIVVTSRIVGYRDMPYRMGGGFEHGVIADLTREDKDLFARRWVALTEQHQPQREQDARTEDLIAALHSNDRIERLTGNPMLLTTLALVKRKVGKLPSRRNKLYAETVAVLLNWNPRHYDVIDEAEAIPQLSYLAYEMCRRGVQRLTEDQVLELLEAVRRDYPNVRALRQRTPEAFLDLLEARSSILIKSGGAWRGGQSAEPIWEFRHLTLQEYLAARALLEGRYPGREKGKSLADVVAPLAGTLRQGKGEPVVAELWQETLRLLVADAHNDDVDEVLLAILRPQEGEGAGMARPRAALAMRCLSDEPNVLEETAERVLVTFIALIAEDDGMIIRLSNFVRAAIEVGASVWGPRLKQLLIQEFLASERKSLWHRYGDIAGLIEAYFAPQDDARKQEWEQQLVEELKAPEDHRVALAAMTVMNRSHSFGHPMPRVVNEQLLTLLRRDEPLPLAASWGLMWQASLRRSIAVPWRPSGDDLRWIIEALALPRPLESDTIEFLALVLKLGNIKATDTYLTEPLLALLGNADVEVRLVAAQVLGRISDQRAMEPLLACLDDDDARVQLAAAAALSRNGDQRGKAALVQHLQSSSSEQRTEALAALAQAFDKESMALLSRDLDGLGPWLDPAVPITAERSTRAAEVLGLSADEVRARYEALAAELPLRLAWTEPAG